MNSTHTFLRGVSDWFPLGVPSMSAKTEPPNWGGVSCGPLSRSFEAVLRLLLFEEQRPGAHQLAEKGSDSDPWSKAQRSIQGLHILRLQKMAPELKTWNPARSSSFRMRPRRVSGPSGAPACVLFHWGQCRKFLNERAHLDLSQNRGTHKEGGFLWDPLGLPFETMQ